MGFTSSDLVSMHTLLTGRVRAREGRQRTTASSPLSPGSSASIKGEKHGRFLSLHCHNIDSRVSGNVAVSYTGGGRIEDLRNRTRDGASYLWRLDLSWTVGRQCKEGGNTEHMRRRHSTHRDEFCWMGSSRQEWDS